MGRGGRIGVGATDGAGGSEGTGGGGGALGGQKGAAPLPPFVARRPGGSRSAANGAQRGPALPSVAPFIRFARSSVPSPVHRSVHSFSSPFGDAAAVAAAPPKRESGAPRGHGSLWGKEPRVGRGGEVWGGFGVGLGWGGSVTAGTERCRSGRGANRWGRGGTGGSGGEPRAARGSERGEPGAPGVLLGGNGEERGGRAGGSGGTGGENGEPRRGGSGRAERGALGAAER